MKCFKSSTIRLLLFGFIITVYSSSANADFTFGTPTNLGPAVNSSSNDAGPSISADGLTLYFSSNRSGGSGGYDLWFTTRATINDDWGPAVNLGQPPNSQYSYWEPSISSDGLTLYFSDGHSPEFGNRMPGGLGGQGDIWMITRPTIYDDWSAPVNIGSAVNSQHAIHPSISSDGLSLYFQSHRPGALGHCDIMVTTRESTSDPFGDPMFLKNVNTSGPEWTPDISADGLTLFFMRNPGPTEIWTSTRGTTDDDFGSPIKLPSQVNMPGYHNGIPHLSADGSTLYFISNRPGGFGGWDLWQVPIIPIVDFNGDGIININDLVILIDNWGQDEPSVDIGPTPWGDGVVDIEDLKVFIRYWEQENQVTDLIAHWKLDETEGNIAYDSADDNNATVHGAIWTEGKIDGSLQFNGFNDYVDCGDSELLGPEQMTFSMWLKPEHMGGMRYIVDRSKKDSDDIDYAIKRHLAGEVEFSVGQLGSDPLSVMSQANTALGEWSHVAVCLDGSQASIYINGQRDSSASYTERVPREDYWLVISSLRASTRFYNGKIDDVRIYDQALSDEEIGELAR